MARKSAFSLEKSVSGTGGALLDRDNGSPSDMMKPGGRAETGPSKEETVK